MAESPTTDPQQDPVVSTSLSLPLLISALLLVMVLLWSLYDEVYGQRPWKTYQESFVKKYSAFVKKELPKQAAQEKAIRQSPEFQSVRQSAIACQQRFVTYSRLQIE